MGVNELWSILEPVRESVPLYSLVGKTLAVDLSLWVCEAQSVKEMMGRVTKPYLRNLFFRVSTLTLMGIKLIFVMEGEAPKIKAETMSRRTQLRFGGSKKQVFKQSKPNRSHFKFVLKECAEMLDCLGVPWVTATGEAEAMCAFLDSSGLVDGCITNDGDIFLYGGQTVYRNFSMNTKDPQVDCYKMQRVQSELHLDRETLVGVAILLGCDYMPKGIAGVGKEQTLKLVETLKGKTLLQKFNEWEDEGQVTQEKSVKKVTHCHVCHHPGTAKSHEHSGCQLCNSKRFCEPQDYKYCCPCEWHLAEHSRQNSTVEFSVKRKTLASDRFPFTEIINEFLVPKDRKIENFTRRKPNLLLMQNFALDKMDWPKHYTSEKVLPLITYTEMINVKCGKKTTSQLHPIRIHKPRVRNGIASFEIIWKKPEHYIHGDSTPEECQGTVSTVEEQCLFRTAYPDIVDQFTSKNAEAKENKYKYQKLKNRKMNRLQESEEISELFTLMNLHSSCEDKISSTSEMKIMLHSDITVASKGLDCPQSLEPEKSLLMVHTEWAVPQKNPIKEVTQSEHSASGGGVTTADSPSVSTIIDDLHLSEIDWEALSFTSSPQVQNCKHTTPTQPDLSKSFSSNKEQKYTPSLMVSDRERANADQLSCLYTVRPQNPQPLIDLSQGSLRSRVLLKKATEYYMTDADLGILTPTSQSTILKSVIRARGDPKIPNPLIKVDDVTMVSGQAQMHMEKELNSVSPKVANKHCSKLTTCLMAQKAEDRSNQKHLAKYKFSRTNSASHANTKKAGFKKSVCIVLCSSSDDSDVENTLVEKWSKTANSEGQKKCWMEYKSKMAALKTGSTASGSDLNPVPSDGNEGKSDTEESVMEELDQSSVSASKMCVCDGDDSVSFSDSPLPLAERLKLKYI